MQNGRVDLHQPSRRCLHSDGASCYSSGSLYSLGRWCAMPLWQSIHVLPSSLAFMCFLYGVCFCSSELMASKAWQLRHSCELLAFMRSHSCVASVMRLASNFSLVSMSPMILPHTSKLARALRIILGPHSRGTWQSEQMARTPVRLE